MTYLNMVDMRSPDLEALRGVDGVVGLIPLAAVEQHGPHLPIATDWIIASHLARLIAERLEVPVLVAPCPPGGLSWHHLGFAGTVDQPRESLAAFVKAYVRAMNNVAIRRFAIFSSHGGNFSFVDSIVGELSRAHQECDFVGYSDLERYVRVMADAAATRGVRVPASDIHAGGLETSQMLHLWGPDRIEVPDGLTGYVEAEPGWLDVLFKSGVKALSDNGVLGDPSVASAEAGEAICGALADELATWVTASLTDVGASRSSNPRPGDAASVERPQTLA